MFILENTIFVLNVLGALIFISVNPRVQIFGSVTFIISNCLSIVFFLSKDLNLFALNALLFLLISLVGLVNRKIKTK